MFRLNRAEVTNEEVQRFVRDNEIAYFSYVSAKEGFNVKQVFEKAAKDAYDAYCEAKANNSEVPG